MTFWGALNRAPHAHVHVSTIKSLGTIDAHARLNICTQLPQKHKNHETLAVVRRVCSPIVIHHRRTSTLQ